MAKKPVKKATKKPIAKKRAPAKKILNMMDMSAAVEPKDYLKVTAINPESDNMTEAFGITKERFKELDILTMTAMKSTEKFTAAVEMVSTQCKHPNELAMCVFLLSEERHSVPPLIKMIMGMRRGPGPNPDQG
jgi:hypothetical protein